MAMTKLLMMATTGYCGLLLFFKERLEGHYRILYHTPFDAQVIPYYVSCLSPCYSYSKQAKVWMECWIDQGLSCFKNSLSRGIPTFIYRMLGLGWQTSSTIDNKSQSQLIRCLQLLLLFVTLHLIQNRGNQSMKVRPPLA